MIAELNDYQFELEKGEGEFVWHSHQDTDEAFIIIRDTLQIEFRDGKVRLNEGEIYVIPRGVEHRPITKGLCQVMLVEPKGGTNTGNSSSTLSAENDIWI